MTWNDQFLRLFRRCVEAYRGGNDDFETYYSQDDLCFLKSIGYKPRELFDFVEDLEDAGEPTESTALLIAAVRRDYLMVMQGGNLSSYEITNDKLPAKSDSYRDITYLPRIVSKAMHKLRGELDPNIMFGCGGDRSFLRNNGNIHPADFLRHVWATNGDLDKIADYILTQRQ